MVAAVAAGTLAQVAAADDSIVRTHSGPVRGTVSAQHRTFQGIPYAAPPVGELRWRSPRPPKPWSGPRDATRPGNRCAQGQSFTPPSEEEDCLYLDVTTPRPETASKPVMVWLHGGGMTFGSGAEHDAHRLATAGDVVVVTPNYRLGLLGFLGHPRLEGSGTFGLQDQRAALRWVKRNARAFGGDPRNVTLFGQSGGALAVCAQLTSPAARGLLRQAIMQSGSCSFSFPDNGLTVDVPAGSAYRPLRAVQEDGVALARRHGCTDPATALDCLRRLPVSALLAAQRGVVLTSPAFGTPTLPEDPVRALATGRFHRVPVMSGTTRDETRLQTAFFPPFTEASYQRLLVTAYGARAPAVAERYRSSELGSPALAWATSATDRVWACPQLLDDRRLARRVPTYAFEFADRDAPQRIPFPPDLPHGAAHASDVPYLFDLDGFAPTFTPDQRRLADRMIGYWSRFAATGDPNRRGLPHWARLRRSRALSLAPGAGGIRPVDVAREHQCGFWTPEVGG